MDKGEQGIVNICGFEGDSGVLKGDADKSEAMLLGGRNVSFD